MANSSLPAAASRRASGELKIWNTADSALVRTVTDAHSDTVFGLEFSPDAEFLASSAADRFVKVFQVATGKLHKSFEGHTHHVLDVSWKSDGKVLASCGADNVIKIWDFLTGDQRRTTAAVGKEVTSINFVGATPKLFTSSGDKSVRLVNTDNGAAERAPTRAAMISCIQPPSAPMAGSASRAARTACCWCG